MKSFLLFLSFVCLAATLFGQGPLITEISYDNNYDQTGPDGIDSTEYVEIYLPNPQPTDPTSWNIVSYNTGTGGAAEVGFIKDMDDAIMMGNTPNGAYYIIEFVDSTFFGFPSAGLNDGMSGIALVEVGSPNIVHQFWRYETCDSFTAANGPAAGAVSSPITTDFSRVCGSTGVFLVQMNSAISTNWSIQQNGFGDWELGPSSPAFENDSNVPINLLSFNAEARGENAHLTWTTGQEFANDYFSILHSTDGRSFEEIGTVLGNGDSNWESSYDFTTENLSGGDHYFKLKQVDFDGSFEVFRVRTVKIKSDAIALYPTLATSEITLTNVDPGTTIQLFDIQGRLMKEEVYQSTINVAGLINGTYTLKVGEAVLRFIKN